LSETLADGRFRLERTLGRGGMAIVYLAHDEELHGPVAVKVLEEHLADDENIRKRFLREARFAARLSHPNGVHVYDAGETNGQPFIVMEYVPGQTLAESGQLPVTETVQLALQACAGLQHAHDAGLIHRDVKPGNLLLREDGVLKVADFGIARTPEATHLTQLGTILGTAEYLAPEQAAGEEVTAAADIYSLGAVLYELLTGRPPYQFDSLAELAEKQSNGVIAPVRDLEPAVPEPVEAVVMRCLARDPRFRPASAAEVAHDLAGAVEAPTEPLLATAVTEPLQARRYESIPGSGAWLAIAAAAAVALVAVVLGLLQLGDGGGGSPGPTPPARVGPPARGETPAAQARNLSAWLRRHSR
jgi:serine/threonine protein kinase